MQDIEQFGKYQFMIYGLITLPLVLSACFTLGYVFTAGEVKYRCLVPECEKANSTSLTDLPWLNNSLSKENCKRFAPRNPRPSDDCTDPSFFDRDKTLDCDAWVYDPDEITIHNEWGITCDVNRWKLTLVGTLNNLGQLVGLTFASTMSDKYGRRTVLIAITFLAGLSGIIHSFSVNYLMFVIFEFIDSLFTAGMYSACFIYAMEMTGVKMRIMGSTALACIYAVGEIILGLVAMWVKNWRILMRLIYGPGLLAILLLFILPESVRWLLANDKRDRAEKVYRKMARVNNIDLTEEAFLELKNINDEKKNDTKKAKDGGTEKNLDEARITQIFRSPKILVRLVICSFCWLTNTFVYYGMSLNATELSGNKYVNFILVTAIEIPGCILVYPLLNRIGRRLTLSGAFILGGVCCLASQFIPDEKEGTWPIISLVLYICGKGCITVAFSTTYVYTTELFPTTLRHSLLGICSIAGRIGSILSPQTPLLAKFTFEGLPLILFGGMGLIAGFLTLSFPETLGIKLPDTLEEAEQIGLKKPEKPMNGSANGFSNA